MGLPPCSCGPATIARQSRMPWRTRSGAFHDQRKPWPMMNFEFQAHIRHRALARRLVEPNRVNPFDGPSRACRKLRHCAGFVEVGSSEVEASNRPPRNPLWRRVSFDTQPCGLLPGMRIVYYQFLLCGPALLVFSSFYLIAQCPAIALVQWI